MGRVPLREAVELATMGRERPLRNPLRPIRDSTRVLIFALDGVGYHAFHEALENGRLPNIAALLGRRSPADGETFARAYSVPDVVTILPSSTTAGWTSLFTGEPPARTGIPGNEWFDREDIAFWAPVPISVRSREHATRQFTDELLSDLLQAPTLFEQVDLRAHVSLNPVFRGADLLTFPNLATFGDLVESMAVGVIRGGVGRDPDVHRESDQTSVRSLLGAIRDHGVPDIQVVYFPGIDLFTHESEDPAANQQRYLAQVTDSAVAQVIDVYRRTGVLGDTYVLFVADHGHTPVLADDRHSLGVEGESEPAAVLEVAGFRTRPFSLHAKQNDFQAVLAYQGAMAFVYLADRSTCPSAGDPCEWQRPPRLEQDVLPAARAFFEANRSGSGAPALQGTLDLILAREPRPVGEDALPFKVFDGERLVPIAEYLRENPRPDLLRLEERLGWLAEGPYGHRAGDVLLLARSGPERPIEERFHFSEPEQHSDHGGAHAQDSQIPLVVAHAARSGAELRQTVRDVIGGSPSQLDFVRLVQALLGRR